MTYKINFPNRIIELFDLINYFRIFIQISKLVKKNPSDIFYLHTPLASHIFRLFTYLHKIKIIYFVHGFRFTSYSNNLKNIIFKFIEKILSYKTDVFITINNQDFDYVKNNFMKKSSHFKINGVGLDLSSKNFRKKFKVKKEIKNISNSCIQKRQRVFGYIKIGRIIERSKDTNSMLWIWRLF